MSKYFVFLILGLMAGLAGGSWMMRVYYERTLGSWNPADRLLAQLDQDLKLNSDQKVRIGEILSDQKDRMEELRHQWKFQVGTLDRQGEDAIVRVLTPDQADQFVKIHDRIHGRMDRFLWTTDSGPTAIAVGPSGK